MAKIKPQAMRPLTDAQLWAVLYEMFGGRAGLCFALARLRAAGLVTQQQYHRARGQFIDLPRADGAYLFPVVNVGTLRDAKRQDLCKTIAKKLATARARKRRRR